MLIPRLQYHPCVVRLDSVLIQFILLEMLTVLRKRPAGDPCPAVSSFDPATFWGYGLHELGTLYNAPIGLKIAGNKL